MEPQSDLSEKTHVTYVMLFGGDYNNAFVKEWSLLETKQTNTIFLMEKSMFLDHLSATPEAERSKKFSNDWSCFKSILDAFVLFVPTELLKAEGSLDPLGFKKSAFFTFDPCSNKLNNDADEEVRKKNRAEALANIFTPSPTIEKSVIVGGHGSSCFSVGVADLDKDQFALLLNAFCTMQVVKIVIIGSCSAGGKNRVEFFRDKHGNQLKLSFVVVIMNPTDTISYQWLGDFEKFNKQLVHYTPDIPLEQFFSECIGEKGVCLGESIYNLPVARGIGEISFSVVPLDNHATILRDGCSSTITVRSGRIGKIEGITSNHKIYYAAEGTAPGKPLLFDGFLFPCTLKYSRYLDMVCTLVSSVPGPSWCVIFCINVGDETFVVDVGSLEREVANNAIYLHLDRLDSTQKKVFFVRQLGNLKQVVIDLNQVKVYVIKPESTDDVTLAYCLWNMAQPLPEAVPNYDKQQAFVRFNTCFWGEDNVPQNADKYSQIATMAIKDINLLFSGNTDERIQAFGELQSIIDKLKEDGCDQAVKALRELILNKSLIISDLVVDEYLAPFLCVTIGTTVELNFCGSSFVDLTINVPTITSLDLSRWEFGRLKLNCPSLTSLNLRFCKGLKNPEINCPQLIYLNLTCSSLTDELLAKILAQCGNRLQTLDLSWCTWLKNPEMKCPKLTYLNLTCSSLTDELLAKILSQCGNQLVIKHNSWA